MRLLFKDYLAVFVVIVALVALIFAISWIIPSIERATGEITDDFGDKVEELIDGPQKDTSAAGLYDASDDMVASWEELYRTYGLNVGVPLFEDEYETATTSLYYVLTHNEELSAGVKLVMDPSADTINMYACAGVTQLTTVIIPDIDLIEPYAFQGCTGLTTVEMGHVRAIGSGIFSGCSSLTTVELPESMTKIPGSMFSKCSSLTSYTIGENVTAIENSAFSRTGLTSIVIPGNVKTIGSMAFWWCRELESVTLGSGVEEIGDSAFGECTELKSIFIPASVTYIGMTAFDGSGITDIYYEGSEEDWAAINIDSWNEQLETVNIIYNHSEASYS